MKEKATEKLSLKAVFSLFVALLLAFCLVPTNSAYAWGGNNGQKPDSQQGYQDDQTDNNSYDNHRHKTSVKECDIYGIDDFYTYTGEQITPSPKVYYGWWKLKEDVDYLVTYDDNIEAGKATVTIEGIGDFKGTVTETFIIKRAVVDDADVTGVEESYTYTGESIEGTIEQNINVKVDVPAEHHSIITNELTQGTDYVVTYEGNTTNVTNATVLVKVSGVNNYKGISFVKVIITAKAINSSDISVASLPNYVYNGNAKTPVPVVTDNTRGTQLVEGTDYTVEYSNNTNVGTATVTITGIGNYNGTRTAEFVISPMPIEISATGNVFKQYSAQEDAVLTFGHNITGFSTANFKSLTVDGQVLTPGKDFTLGNGSIVATFSKEYLNTLALGDHEVVLYTQDSSNLLDLNGATAETVLKVIAEDVPASESPKTSDEAPIAPIAATIAIAGLAAFVVRRRAFED